MATQRVSRKFKDIDLSFEPNPVTNDISILLNERAINNSIKNLVLTIPTERFFNSVLGSDVRSQLFELSSFAVLVTIESQIDNTISLFEPRVKDVSVVVEETFDENTLEVTITYTIIGQEIPSQPFTFILEATR